MAQSAANSPDSNHSRPEQYMVVARRYRPQTFSELIGQEHVARALTNAITANRVGHAYLFTGARGVGKTSAARILAKALDCVHGPTPTPCNACDICQSISAGSDVDVLEIDGASNRGIDEIRQLRQNVNIRPSRARFKIYIIDEVHMLTREAFNALLKTLEEPPEHVKFIFCTTEATKIPVTILSRCQRFDFAGIHLPSIVERLKQIVYAEGVTADEAALALLARRANGSMRDSQSLLEQLLAFGDEHLTVADVHTLLGTAGEARLSGLMSHLVARDAAAAIADLDTAMSEGVDVGQLLEQLLGYFRDAMTASVGCPDDTLLHTSSAERPQLNKLAGELGLETILAVMQILDQTLSRLRYSTQSRTLAEMALVRIASLENLDELSDLVAQLRSGVVPEPAAGRATAPRVSPPAPHASGPSGVSSPAGSNAKKKDDLSSGIEQPSLLAAGEPLTADNVASVWRSVLANFSGLLEENASRAGSVAFHVPNRLVATFPAKYTSCKAFCERPEQLQKLEAAMAAATSTTIKIEFALLAEEEPAGSGPGRGVNQRQRLAEKAEHPLVRRAGELFDAQLMRIEEPGN